MFIINTIDLILNKSDKICIQKGELCKVKKKFVMALLLVILMTVPFTGCEAAPPLSAIVSTTKGYNDEIIALIVSHVVGQTPADFTADSAIEIDERINCFVDYTDTSVINLSMTLDDWVASDGTEVSGTLDIYIDYYTSPVHVSRVRMRPAMLYFDRTSINFETEIYDGDADDVAFTSENHSFLCLSLIVDGDTLITSMNQLK